MAEVNRIGMLTGGGDAPGLNGVIRAVTILLHEHRPSSIGCFREVRGEVVGLDILQGESTLDNVREGTTVRQVGVGAYA